MAIRLCLALLTLSLYTLATSTTVRKSWAPKSRFTPFCTRLPGLVCYLRATAGNRVTGTILFDNVANPNFRYWRWGARRCNVRVIGRIHNLAPGLHGTHIHAYGDERSTDGSSLGGHFLNPWFHPVPHGLRGDSRRHWGDFGNIVATSSGFANVHFVDLVITLRGIVGRGIVVHAGQDMGAAEQPSGASGPRIATCVIGFANPEQKKA